MDDNRCGCGRFMACEDRSTESGYDFEFVCYNPKCIEAAKADNEHIVADMGKFVEFCAAAENSQLLKASK